MTASRAKQFSVRGLFVAITVCAVLVGTWSQRAHKQRRAVRAILESGGEIQYDFQVDANGKTIANAASNTPHWLVRALGHDFFCRVNGVALYPDARQSADDLVKLLDGIPYLTKLAIWPGVNAHSVTLPANQAGGLTDNGADYLLANLPLKHLSLSSARLSDEAIERLSKVPRLRSLQISRHTEFGGDSPVQTSYDKDNNPIKVVRLDRK